MKQRYVCGFMFSPDGKFVALIHKNRGPANIAGTLNGIGGKIDEGEKPIDAMTREFNEETNVSEVDWLQYAHLEFENGIVYFFRCFSCKVYDVKTMEDEYVAFYPVEALFIKNYDCYHNLKWLIPLALDNSPMAGILDNINH